MTDNIHKYIGKKIANRYFITGEIGKGGMGRVFSAIPFDDPSQTVAIKVIFRENQIGPEDLLRFQKEAALMSRLYHPNIICFYELGLLNETNNEFSIENNFGYYIVMEFAIGKNLKESLNRDGKKDISFFLQVAIQISSALDYMHRKNIVHRDIKPQNIIVGNSAQDPRGLSVKVLDFGVSRLIEAMHTPQGIEPSKKAFEDIAGTPLYMAPEQTRLMDAPVDHRVDLYSLGCVLYEILAGHPPFIAKSRDQLEKLHVYSKPEPITAIRQDIPPIIGDIINKLLQKNPDERYQSAFSLYTDLLRIKRKLERKEHLQYINFPLAINDKFQSISAKVKILERTQELETLINYYNLVAQPKGRAFLVTINGEIGVGKTSLLNKFKEYLARKKIRFIKADFSQHDSALPFNALANAFNDYLLQVLKNYPYETEEIRRKVKKMLGPAAQDIATIIPALNAFISESNTKINIDINKIDFKMLTKKFSDFIRCLTIDNEPIVFLFDDLHWADEKSLKLIEYFFSYNNSQKFLLVITYDKSDINILPEFYEFLDKFRQLKRRFQQLELKPLSYENTINLINNLLDTYKPIPTELATHIYSKTNGNPLYIIELVRALISKDLIYFSHKVNDWYFEIELIKKVNLELNIIDIAIKQISNLNHIEQTILNIAAVIGMSFQFELLRLQINDYEINSADVVNTLNKALALNIINKIPEDPELKELGKSYAFVHWRVRDSLYKNIPQEQKNLIHKLIALKLERYVSRTKSKKLFAMVHHLNKACLNEREIDIELAKKLVKYNILAGKVAKDLGSWQSAQGYFEIAYNKARSMPNNVYSPHELAYMIENIGDILSFQKRYGSAIKYYEEALTLTLNNKELWASLNYKILTLNLIVGFYTKSINAFKQIQTHLNLASPRLNLFKQILLYCEIVLDIIKIWLGQHIKLINKAINYKGHLAEHIYYQYAVKIYNIASYLYLPINPLVAIYYHYKAYKLCLKTTQSPDNILKILAEHVIVISNLGFKRLSYKILDLVSDTAKNLDYQHLYGYTSLIKAVFLDYPYLKDDEVSEQINNAIKNISVYEDRPAFTLAIIFQMYKELIKGNIHKVLKISKIIPEIIPTRNHLSAKAMALVFYTYFLYDSRDTIVKLGEQYIKRRQQVAARPDDMFIRIINTIITFAKGEIEKTRAYYTALINEFTHPTKEKFLFPFLKDFVFLFAYTLPAFFEQEYGRQIMRNIELKPLFVSLKKKLKKKNTQKTAVIKLILAKSAEFFKQKNVKVLYDQALIQSKTCGYHLLQAFTYLWFGQYLLQLGHKKRINYIFKVRNFGINNKIKLLVEYAEKLLEKYDFEFKKSSTSHSLSIQNKVENGIFNFNFILQHITHLCEALTVDTFLEQNIQESLNILQKYFNYERALLIIFNEKENKYEVIYSTDDKNNYSEEISYVEPYINIKTTLFLPYLDTPWAKAKFANKSIDFGTQTQSAKGSFQRVDNIWVNQNDHQITVVSADDENKTLVINATQNDNFDNNSDLINYKHKTLLSYDNNYVLNIRKKSPNTCSNAFIPILGIHNNIGILLIENLNLSSYEILATKNQMDMFGIHIGLMITLKKQDILSHNKALENNLSVTPTEYKDNICNLLYKPASYCVEKCSWLKMWTHGKLRQKRESVWYLGLELNSAQYLLAYCRLNGLIEIREKLSSMLWYYLLSIKTLHHNLENLNFQIDDLKKDIQSLLLSFSYTKDLETISIAFTIFDKRSQTAQSGHFGPSRPVVIFQENEIMPTNQVIITLQNGRDIRFWYTKAKLQNPHIYLLAHDTSKIELNYSETFKKDLTQIEFNNYNSEQFLKFLQTFIPPEIVPRYYVAAVMNNHQQNDMINLTQSVA